MISAEFGNIFKFGTEKSEKMKITFTDNNGREQYAYLASYGIGITRVMGVIVEKLSDENGLVWPENIAPARVHLISIGADEETEKLYQDLKDKDVSVLYDDRDSRAGEKLADADLIGIPHRVVVSNKSLENGGFEYKLRTELESKIITQADLYKLLNIQD